MWELIVWKSRRYQSLKVPSAIDFDVEKHALRSHEFLFNNIRAYRCILQTLTHLRIAVNILVGIMLGCVFLRSGADGSRVLDNYNLLFSILIHHMMTTMMLTIVTCKYPCASREQFFVTSRRLTVLRQLLLQMRNSKLIFDSQSRCRCRSFWRSTLIDGTAWKRSTWR